MMISSALRAPFLLALIAGCFVAEGVRNRITIKSYKTNYRVDWYDDGRDNPYRVTFWKFGLKSVYKFDESGNMRALTAGDDRFTFDENIGSRKLTAPQDADVEEEEHSSRRRLYDCTDCEETWDTLCDVGLADACYLDDNTPDYFTEDAEDSVRRMCSAFGAACQTAASEACDGQCTEDDIPEACDPNPCENDGECSADPGGGHMCSCASGYGGMACQTDTSSLDAFYIEVEYLGTWTDARKAVFETAADRWAEVITHVPCGGYLDVYPAGRVLISATLGYIDGVGGTLGYAGRTSYWDSCPTISATGEMTFDIADIDGLESDGTFEGVILHEMSHVMGVGSTGFAVECSTCSSDGDPAWLCPAALSAYYDLGGTNADILELDGGTGTSCGHLDEDIFVDELMTGYVNSIMYLSKMTAALLDDLEYIVDPTEVDPYTLPSQRAVSVTTEEGPSILINDIAVPVMIHAIKDDGTLVEVEDISMVF